MSTVSTLTTARPGPPPVVGESALRESTVPVGPDVTMASQAAKLRASERSGARGRRHRAAAARVRPVGSTLAGLRPPAVPDTRRPAGLQPSRAPLGRTGLSASTTRDAGADAATARFEVATVSPQARPKVSCSRAVSTTARPSERVAVRRSQAPGITRRGRLLLTCAVVAVAVLVLSVAGVALAGGATSAQTPIVYTTVTLEPGQSLWEVAGAIAPHNDPRSTIAGILELNDLSSPSDIRVGQQIAVPAAPRG